ncbi:hypothetical protein Q7P37_008516 [Cladosporium fusiforme]
MPALSIPSPLTTHLPHLTASEIAALPYPPDIFPGARDVKTAYGHMRVYEWGSEGGRKVMLVHGDATSSPIWKGIAERLVKSGCRVIVLDLWGRGYTDTPEMAHDSQLLALQLLFAASSSPLPWCTEMFSIVGFSLGGGITMEFVASFPHLVRSVALLAPAGLLRALPGVYEDLKKAARDGTSAEELKTMLPGVLGLDEEVENDNKAAANAVALARWQYEHHEGHPISFVSTLINGPVQDQHQVWREACKVLKEKQEKRQGGEMLVAIGGSDDNVVPAAHIREDLDEMMGKDHYVFETVKGNHSFPLDDSACEKVFNVLVTEWKL